MKIFNEENGIKKVYVQMNDIMMLNQLDEPIPASIYEKIFTQTIIINDSNRMDFKEFTEFHEIEFFKKQDWIIDYKKIKDLSLEDIKLLGEETNKEIEAIRDKFNNMSESEKRENLSLIQQHELLVYKMNYYAEVYRMKNGKSNIKLPLIPDCDGFKLNDDKAGYAISISLEPNKLLLYKKDGNKLSSSDKVDPAFIQGAISIMAMENTNNKIFMGNYKTNTYLSEDKKYLVIEFVVMSYDNKDTKKEEKGIKRLINKLLKK